jgi:hypothetical protein
MLVMGCVEVQAASVQTFKTFPSCASADGTGSSALLLLKD